MAKGGKSSASSATRKKHAKKSDLPAQQSQPGPSQPQPKGKKGKGKKEPKVKVYIPPPKYTPLQPDPLDTYGLVGTLDPEMVVVLRRLAKKDVTTRRRALDELVDWAGRGLGEGEDGSGSGSAESLREMLPVWFHHLPNLLTHPARQLRLSALAVQQALLASPAVRPALLAHIATRPEDEQEKVLGAWCMAASDADRGVAALGRATWEGAVAWAPSASSSPPQPTLLFTPTSLLPPLIAFLAQTLHSPLDTFAALHPPTALPAPATPAGAGRTAKQAAMARLKGDDVPQRAKGEMDEEAEDERVGRLRVGALGALTWILDTYPHDPPSAQLPPSVDAMLASPRFWTHISSARTPPWAGHDGDPEPGFGHGQIGVRRAAWGLVRVLMGKWHESVSARPFADVMAPAILRSAWVEPDAGVRAAMWEPVLSFLTKVPGAWEIEVREGERGADGEEAGEGEGEDDDEDDEDGEDEDDTETDTPRAGPPHPTSQTTTQQAGSPSPAGPIRSAAYDDFLDFLRTACRGSAVHGYPTVLVVLSTIPPSILPLTRDALLELFRAFRAVSDDRVIGPSGADAPAFRAFLSSLLESMVYLSGKVWRAGGSGQGEGPAAERDGDGRDGVVYVIAQEFERLASLLMESPALLADQEAVRTVGRTLVRLNQIDPALFDTAWTPLALKFREAAPRAALPRALGTLHTTVKGTPCEAVLRAFILQYGGAVLSSTDWSGASSPSLDGLLSVLQHFGALLCSEPAFSQTLTAVLHENLPALLALFPPKAAASVLVEYLTHQLAADEVDEMWHTVLRAIGARRPGNGGDGQLLWVGLPVLDELCRAVEQGRLARPLRARGGELNELVHELLLPTEEHVLPEGLVSGVLRYHERFLDEETTASAMRSLGQLFKDELHASLRHSARPQHDLLRSLRTLHSIPASLSIAGSGEPIEPVLPSLFLAAFILPCCHADVAVSALAQQVFDLWLVSVPDAGRTALVEEVRGATRECIEDVRVAARPSDIVIAYTQHMPLLDPGETPASLITEPLLSRHFADILKVRFPPILSAMDPLVPAGDLVGSRTSKPGPFDKVGFSVYARCVAGLVQAVTGAQSVALPPERYWTIRHMLALSTLIGDFVSEPGVENVLFAAADVAELGRLASLVDLVVRHTFSASVGDLSSAWHQATIARLRKAAPVPDVGEDALTTVIAELYANAAHDKSILGARVFCQLLGLVSPRSATADVERWLALAQSVEDKHPSASLAIILAVKDSLAESPRLNRYQNELASRLSGVPPSRANSQGLPLLRLLIASAPSAEALGPFIPQQRAIFLIQALQKWIVSDEDLDEEIDRRLGELFEALAPIILDVPGGHWDLIFELLENNLEASTAEEMDLPLLFTSLRLLTTVRDFSMASSVLREAWADHESQAMQLICQLFLSKLEVDQSSLLQRECRNYVINLAQELPASLIDDVTMEAMYSRLSDKSVEVQKTAYRLLHTAIPKVTEQRVIEAAVNTSSTPEEEDPMPRPLFTLPAELVTLLLEPLESVDNEEDGVPTGTFGRLLAWMVLFDFFIDASPALKASYVEQLRSGDLLGRSLLPSLLPLLPILRSGKQLAVNLWSVEEFYVELYDDSGTQALSVLAAHLFYRALSTIPSLVRSWWLDIKDRQLSSAIATFAGTHFSPIIVSAEFAKLRQPHAEEELAHENLSLKVATNVSEVTVAYTVDEQQMELGIRLPPDFPLHGVEVRDIKRVGVPVEKWRQWMLQVQQTITSQNGFLLDALILFKKNVTLYFEGVVECAICYSVISTTDRSLPTKPCKTCKNLFHNSCLYKWFNTSNQSSCPLCRSQF